MRGRVKTGITESKPPSVAKALEGRRRWTQIRRAGQAATALSDNQRGSPVNPGCESGVALRLPPQSKTRPVCHGHVGISNNQRGLGRLGDEPGHNPFRVAPV